MPLSDYPRKQGEAFTSSSRAYNGAGLRAFAEAANRELALAGQQAIISFFSPSPADTEAERPFHPLWRALGTAIVSPDRVTAELVKAVDRRETVHIMGGWSTRFFAALNAVSPHVNPCHRVCRTARPA